MKKIVRKGELVIYAVALMLVTAGYFNYNKINDAVETSSNDVYSENLSSIGDVVLVGNNNDESDYYTNSKLDREKMYAEMIKNYQDILNNTNASETQKSIATQEISKINDVQNTIMICENLIEIKDFNECLILINGDNIEIVVNTENGLDTVKVSQIQNIITREFNTEVENIHITEK